ncbi:hypothetical protein [Chryseobacterium sp. GP-SGM7]|uniref:hypothetical protein n=1 Tax=Chryseobacterium sp. GP-SGM7 TaxID=3411323 RepID=UPI003B962FD9
MKKFISILIVIMTSISALSCREVEELSVISEKNSEVLQMNKTEQKTQENTNAYNSSANNSSLSEGEPQRDKIKW